MIEAIGQFGASLVSAFGTLALLGLAIWLAVKTLNHFYPTPRNPLAPVREPGCWLFAVVAIAYAIPLFLLFFPSIEALNRYACKGSRDFAECVNPSGP